MIDWNNANIAFDGNSLFAGVGSANNGRVSDQIKNFPPILNSSAIIGNFATSGHTWNDMRSGGSQVDDFWKPDKTNILVLWEHTNSIFNGAPMPSVSEVIDDMTLYINERRAIHPWIIVVLTTLPREGIVLNNTTIELSNIRMDEVDNYILNNQFILGIDCIVDVRQEGSPFLQTGYTTADFDGANAYWAENTPNRVHLNNSGYEIIAGYLADSFLNNFPTVPS